MDVVFINKYTISKEGVSGYFIDPAKRHAQRLAQSQPPGGGKRGNIVRLVGLGIAAAIIVISLIGEMWLFFGIGVLLAIIYSLRILQTREELEQQNRNQQQLNEIKKAAEAPKWVRFIRFGQTRLAVEDPGTDKVYVYEQMTRISEDPAYITLWMNDDTQVRVYKEGFIIGSLEGFEKFIHEKFVPRSMAETEGE